MTISDIVSTEFVQFSPDARVSKVVGAFDDTTLRGVVVVDDGEYRGVVTRRQLASSRHPPDQRVGSVLWNVPRVRPDEDEREVAQLMLDSDARLLPVFEGGDLVGVVTADDLLADVQTFLDAATVGDAASTDLVTVSPDATFGDAIHLLREHRITHLPVEEGGEVVGMLSVVDVVALSGRPRERSEGGDPDGTAGGGTSRGGFGAREGERDRLLDLPVRDLMNAPVRTIGAAETLDVAVGRMLDEGISSLLVDADDEPTAILTKSDVLDALTWGTEGSRAVQVSGTDLLDDMTNQDLVEMVERFDERDADMSIIDARVHLHEHDETFRGTPLVLARVRLYTDRGTFVATGEGYGAKGAVGEARDALERQLRDRKDHAKSKKHPDEAYWDRRFGWLITD